jgi:endoglucanase
MRLFLRKLGLFSKWILLSNAAVLSVYVIQAILPTSSVGISVAHAAAENRIEIWWPSQGAEVTGVQPLQVMLQNKNINDYEMYWSAGSDQVKMTNSSDGYPHKEARVDFTGWTWNSNNAYTLQFIAKDRSGKEISRTSVDIKHAPEIQSTETTTVAPQTTTAPQQTAIRNIEIWWPSENAVLTGTQPIKAMLQNTTLPEYDMFWSVGGDQVLMKDSTDGYPHKEAVVDFTNWNWKGTGPYQITLTAKEKNGTQIAQKSVNITTSQTTQSATTLTQPTTQTVTNTTQTVTTVTNTIGTKLYVDPNNPALAQAQTWKTSRPADASIMEKIGSQSTAIWLGGWNSDVQGDVAKATEKSSAQNAIATFIAYNIPGRDCGQYSAGGANTKDEYLSWIRKISAGLGQNKAILVLEPDGIALIDCLSNQGKYERLMTMSAALDILKANSNTKVYLDAGHAGWINPEEMAGRLKTAGISKAAGFSLNVSNFMTTTDNTTYGEKISAAANGAHFIIDTSRNGSGSNGEWCNPSGRSLGHTATFDTGNSKIDALLWLKRPGESDGNCNGGPSAGTWWPEYALDLAKRAGY